MLVPKLQLGWFLVLLVPKLELPLVPKLAGSQAGAWEPAGVASTLQESPPVIPAKAFIHEAFPLFLVPKLQLGNQKSLPE